MGIKKQENVVTNKLKIKKQNPLEKLNKLNNYGCKYTNMRRLK